MCLYTSIIRINFQVYVIEFKFISPSFASGGAAMSGRPGGTELSEGGPSEVLFWSRGEAVVLKEMISKEISTNFQS